MGLPLALYWGFGQNPTLNGLFGLWLGFYVAQAMIGIYYSLLLKWSKWEPLATSNQVDTSMSFQALINGTQSPGHLLSTSINRKESKTL